EWTNAGRLEGHCPRRDLRDALSSIPSDVDEYTNCRDVIRRAAFNGAGGGGGRGSGGGGGGTGGGGGGNSGGGAPGGEFGGFGDSGGAPGQDPLAGASADERKAIDAARLGGAGPLRFSNGALIRPGELGRHAGTDVPATLATPRRGPLCGLTAAGAFLALALFTVASIAWAAQPADAWVEANRTLTYVAVFAAALALVRALPDRWTCVLGGVALAGVIVCGYALVTKVFPGALNPDELYARLRSPYGYWNSVGLTAAMAVPPLIWLGARRQGPPALNALAFPGLGIVLVALMLAYSRGALLALLIGC